MAKPARKTGPQEAPTPRPGPTSVPDPSPEGPTFTRFLVPQGLIDGLMQFKPFRWMYSVPERRHMFFLGALAVLIFFPYLGSVGFWDPWEPHYGEVARMMIVRQDYVHPYWECAYFFSKPILPLWLMAIGMLISGANDPVRGISVSTEWWVRSIIATLAVVGAVMLYKAVARTIGRRVAVWSAVILVTTPFYFLLARQAMVDMPFVVLNTSAIACLMIAVFEKERVQDGWLYAFYALAGIGCLAKGLLGIALPLAAMLGYLLFSGDWRLLSQLRLITGPIVCALMFMPWYTVMTFFRGTDDETTTWFDRFIIHDHFQRMGEGVHTTTPNTNFTYFIEQLGYGLFPWVAAIPGAFSTFFTRPPVTDPSTRKRKAKLFVIAWAVTTFTFFSFSATKFHHYIFPAVPAIAVLMAIWIERVMEEGVSRHAVTWLTGAALFALVAQNIYEEPKHLTDMFVYNYDRPYPSNEVDPHAAFLWIFVLPPVGALFGAPALRDWGAQLWNWKPQLPTLNRRGILGGLAALSVFVLTGSLYIAAFLAKEHTFWGLRLSPSFTQLTMGQFFWISLGIAVVLTGIIAAIAYIPFTGFWRRKNELARQTEDDTDRIFVVGATVSMALAFALYVSAVHWVQLSYHWTQRDLFRIYEQQSSMDEPIAAYQMNWRGETFYSRNLVRQLKEPNELRDFVAAPPGRKWLLVEHARLPPLRNAIGNGYRVNIINKTFTDKFALITVEPAPEGSYEPQPQPTMPEQMMERYDPNHIH